MVMADAGRDNPWARTRGLAALAENSDVLILYSSAAGEVAGDGVGRNGPFATAVAKFVNEPGVEISGFVRKVRSEVLRLTNGTQHPTSYGELSDREFYFVPPPPKPAPAAIVFSDQPRLALIVGNGDYNGDGDYTDDRDSDAAVKEGYANDLPNTIADARAMRDALQRLHFLPENIVYVENGDKSTMTAALLRFSQKIRVTGSDALVVVYYAGHAIQINGANFLIPIRGKLPPLDLTNMTEEEVEIALRDYAVPINDLVSRLRNPSSLGANVIILDACRNNPWETRTRAVGAGGATRGLADIPNSLRRTAFAFATKPGDTALDGDGANSPYMTVMKNWIERPGLTIRDLFDGVGNEVVRNTGNRQVPWLNSPPMGATCLGACPVAQ